MMGRLEAAHRLRIIFTAAKEGPQALIDQLR